MTLVYSVDLDGVLFENSGHENYKNATPITRNIERVKRLYADGHKIILHTSRLQRDKRRTAKALARYGIPYHSLVMNKPRADVYIDDKAEAQLPHYGSSVKRKPLAICYSGGMDSVIAYWYAIKELGYAEDEILLLNFNIGNNYSDKEAKARAAIGLPFISIKLPIVSVELGNMTSKDNYIIPGRNLVFASIAAGFGDTVWIVGVKFEDHPLMFDKNSAFYRTASLACSQALGATTTVESPFVHWTKTEMIEWMVEQGLQDKLHATVSCYHDTLMRCGNCGLCFKRAIAMYAAGIDERSEYAEDPFKSKVANDFVALYKTALVSEDFTHYSKERIQETLDVLSKAK